MSRWICISFFVALQAAPVAGQGVDFVRDVQPILAKHCVSCHGAEKHKGGLRLDVRAAAQLGGDSGAAWLAGKPGESEIIKRVRGDDPDEVMPPKGDRLSAAQVATLEAWIKAGAAWPDSAAGDVAGRRKSDHWSFQPVKLPALPKVKDTAWPRNEIDYFILAKLEEAGIKPSPEADPYTLVRRLYLDLTGLLPTPQEADAFVKEYKQEKGPGPRAEGQGEGAEGARVQDSGLRTQDSGPSDAYGRHVDRLLASPHYGERWGRHWLDGARYADSNGYSVDSPRVMWPYRDWVINALNADMPFDQFTVEQLAGDLLPNATKSQLIATAFHRNTMINQEGGVKPDQFRIEATMDRVNTTGQVWLALTVGCAQCHTHKFDPITQKEYYELFAFFNSTEDENNTGPTTSLLPAETEKQISELRAEQAKAEKQLKAIKDAKSPEAAKLKKAIDELKKQALSLQSQAPPVMILRELKAPRKSFVFTRGDFLRPGAEVTPDVPQVLPAIPGAGTPRLATRLDLARWLVSPENPLTARVTMNRVWMRYFPRGLVETQEDFGTQGTPPSHPQLLDWLAYTFMQGEGQGPRAKGQGAITNQQSEISNQKSAWSLKAMHRLIVTSAAYRQSSFTRADLATVDPQNRLLARQSRLRVDAEIVRDAALCGSGLLSRRVGGTSVQPPQPPGVYDFTQNKQSWNTSTGEDRYRRGMYTFFFRSAPYPALTTFDVPNMTQTCTGRLRSNTPLQALAVANDEVMMECAAALARRAMESPASRAVPGPGEGRLDSARMTHLFRLCLTRPPTDRELDRLLAFLTLQRQRVAKGDDAAAWTAAARVVMNLDEFITRE